MTSEAVERALLGATLSRPYYARALSAMTVVETPLVPTVALSDRWHLFINPEWFDTLEVGQQIALIAEYQVEHLLRSHGPRFADRQGPKANAACIMELHSTASAPPPTMPEVPEVPSGLLA